MINGFTLFIPAIGQMNAGPLHRKALMIPPSPDVAKKGALPQYFPSQVIPDGGT
jgi:hypothetical protein